jgi:ATP synthase subunit 6
MVVTIMNSPLEQFGLAVSHPVVFEFLDISLTNFGITVTLLAILIVGMSPRGVSVGLKLYKPANAQFVLPPIYSLVSGILVQQSGNKGRPYIGFALTLSLFVLFSNLFGLTVAGLTLTAQLTVTVGLAVSINLGLCLLGFYLHGLRFLKFFVPAGIPILLIPFMAVIEVFPHPIRSVSLSVRLFANMMAGHTLLHIISSFFVVLFWSYSSYSLAGLSPVLPIAISILEIVIAFLQGYIFPILSRIHLNDALAGGEGHSPDSLILIYIYIYIYRGPVIP